jgi:hypothetical protein
MPCSLSLSIVAALHCSVPQVGKFVDICLGAMEKCRGADVDSVINEGMCSENDPEYRLNAFNAFNVKYRGRM